MRKLTDMDLFEYGLKEQKDTWWGKKIEENAEVVRSGKFGEVLKEYTKSSGWGDGVKTPRFVVFENGKARVLEVTESGVFEKCASGGSKNINL